MHEALKASLVAGECSTRPRCGLVGLSSFFTALAGSFHVYGIHVSRAIINDSGTHL